MNAQNTHHIPAFDHIFSSFHLGVSAFIVVYLIVRFLCISCEKDSIWKLCGDLKKEIGGELNLNVSIAALRSYDMWPTSANFATLRCRDVAGTHPARNFLDITKRMKKRTGGRRRERHEIQDKEDYTG